MKNLKKYVLLSVFISMGALSASCTLRGGASFRGTSTYEPQLVEVSPGIWVVEDNPEPVFYDDGYYWRYNSGIWYRSHYHNSGWVHMGHHQVPRTVIQINRPGQYVHYRARGNMNVRRRPMSHSNQRVPAHRGRPAPAVRDHRQPTHRQAPAVRDHRQAAPAPGPAVRDHRRPAPAARDNRRSKPKPYKRDNR